MSIRRIVSYWIYHPDEDFFDMGKINSLSSQALDFFIRALEWNSEGNVYESIDASQTIPEDRQQLVELGCSFTTDRMGVPMGKISQETHFDIIRWRVNKEK